MAAASYLRGRFVSASYKRWDDFTDTRSGETVSAGEGLTVYVFTPHDRELCVVVPEKRTQEGTYYELLEQFAGFEFGDEIEVTTGALRSGKYVGIYEVRALEPVQK